MGSLYAFATAALLVLGRHIKAVILLFKVTPTPPPSSTPSLVGESLLAAVDTSAGCCLSHGRRFQW